MNDTTPNLWFLAFRASWVALVLGAAAGCSAMRGGSTANLTPNVFRAGETLPPDLHRVAVLPLAVPPAVARQGHTRESLEPVLLSELAKANRFELVTVRADSLQQLSGRAEWRTTDRFPTNFFHQIRELTDCDAILMAELTEYRAYPPLAVGWRLQLMEVKDMRVWWAADEIFDAGDAPVADAARQYQLAHSSQPRSMEENREILYSPVRFARFAASVLVATCPTR